MERIVIVGAGHASGQVVSTLRQKQFAGKITLLGDEQWYPYQRPPLSKTFLAGELTADRLYVKPQDFYSKNNIEVNLNTRVTEIDRAKQHVLTANAENFAYDHLIVATGSRVRKLPLPGAELAGVHYLRGIDDVVNIRSQLNQSRRVVIIGAGYIGLEVAAVTARLGHSVTVIEMAERVMSRVVAPEVSQFYQEVHAANGVTLLLSAGIDHLTGTTSVSGVALASGEHLPADVVIIGIGIEPNVALAQGAGLDVEDGIIVDDRCQTVDDRVYAIGDCTRHPNAILGADVRLESVHNAIEQAKTAARNILGEDIRYAQVPWFWSDQYDLKLQIAGLSLGYDQVVLRGSPEERNFSCLYLRHGELIAIDAINRPKDFIQSKALIADHARIDSALLTDTETDLKTLAESATR